MSLDSVDSSEHQRAILFSPCLDPQQRLPQQPQQPQLPEECIQHTIEFLHRDLSSLHSLIRVSKAFFRITLPLLYSSPFDLLESTSLDLCPPNDKIRRHAALLFLLLNCEGMPQLTTSPPQDLSPLRLQQKSGITDSERSSSIWTNLPPVSTTFKDVNHRLVHPSVNYLSLYHHHFLGMNLASTFPIVFPDIQKHRDRLPQHVQQQMLANSTITIYTRNEIEKSFLLHQPHHRVKTVSMPIQRFPAFQSTLDRLCGLVRLELMGISWAFDLNSLIEFLRNHSNLYGTIRELKMVGPNDVRAVKKTPLHGVVRSVPHLRELDLSRYKEATKDLNDYEFQNIANVEKLLFNLEYIPPVTDSSLVKDRQEWSSGEKSLCDCGDDSLHGIQNCTGLKHLEIGINSSTAFRWALDRFNANSEKLPPLQTLHLSANSTSILKSVMEDCLRAFQHTLTDLKGVSMKLSAVPWTNAYFGWDWPLSNLTTLCLRGELAVWFDMKSLASCPRLQDLSLTLHPFSPPSVDHLSDIVLAPQLRSLSLTGRWFMSDDMITRLSGGLKNLHRFVLDRCQCDNLTIEGLLQGLDRMEHLTAFAVSLHDEYEDALVQYAASRPELAFGGNGELLMDPEINHV
ncbi:hypothetical protein BG004_002027 [Podila humilis]|nr:hypothetical protein BG004_002027 [Podila humilis]